MNSLAAITSLKLSGQQFDVEIHIENRKPFYTNGDHIKGKVVFNVHGNHNISSIVISLKGISNTSIEDVSSAPEDAPAGEVHQLLRIPNTVFPDEALASQNNKNSYTFQQGEYIYNFDFSIPKDDYNIQCATAKSLLHLKGFLKDDKSVLPPITLPPSLQHKRSGHDFVNIEYSVDVEVYNKSSISKPSIVALEVFLFVPRMTFITFSANSIKRKASTVGKARFIYKECIDQDVEDGDKKQLAGSSSSLFSFIKKVIPRTSNKRKITCTFKLQARYNKILEPYNTQYNSTRFIKDGTLLSDFLKLTLFTKTRYDDLIKQIYPSSVNTNPENLAEDGEKLILDSLKIKLVTVLQYKSHLLNATKEFKKLIVDSENLNYAIPHEDFQPFNCAENQESDGSNDIKPVSTSSTSASSDQLERKNTLYKFDIPTSFYNCRLETVVPSFVICNVKVTHYLHINAIFKSSLNPKQEGNFKLTSNIIVLKDFLANDNQNYEESVLLPMYSPTPIPAYGIVEDLS